MPHPEGPSKSPAGTSRQNEVCAAPSSYLGIHHGISPRSTPKSVSISKQHEIISPLILGNQKNVEDLDLDYAKLYRKVPLATKRLSGRLSRCSSPLLRPNSAHQANVETTDTSFSTTDHHSDHPHHLDLLIDQVTGWIKGERQKRASRKETRRAKRHARDGDQRTVIDDQDADGESARRNSGESESSFDLDKLENILRENFSLGRHLLSRRTSAASRGKSYSRRSSKPSNVSSDTDYFDGDALVPSCDVVLDNSKTMSYTGGASDDSEISSGDELSRTASYRDLDAWAKFKFEIVRLSHTLRLKGWRRVPMDMSGEITVQRLSGALTNAVYVVSPPVDLPLRSTHQDQEGNGQPRPAKKAPPKLLLRIYGPQVEHLIDREAELAILCRLAKKRIGPRMLGTFANGRFEEYFYAKPLSPDDFRLPDTSRQIAKRMRELHDGIELLDKERDAGPFVWCNWDKWVQRVEQVVSWLDAQIENLEPSVKPSGTSTWKRRGFICGVPWSQFRAAVDKYRSWLEAQYGSSARVREKLVFAHNDTQYGNILRLVPTGDSPLLLPANSHKQLVVIDFEYANANLPGLEFANHFTEWGYNYHDPKKPYAFHPSKYPNREEQERFIRAYVRHRPQFNIPTPNLAPASTPPFHGISPSSELPSRRPTSSIGDFMLDARAPSTLTTGSQNTDDGPNAAEKAAKAEEDREVARLMHETRLWRLANSAQWVAWGLVQAKVPGMPQMNSNADETEPGSPGQAETRKDLGDRAETYRELSKKSDGEDADEPSGNGVKPANDEDNLGLNGESSGQIGHPEKEGEEAEDEFDYLGYAQHRAFFFWADAIELGIVEVDSLPGELLHKLKRVSH